MWKRQPGAPKRGARLCGQRELSDGRPHALMLEADSPEPFLFIAVRRGAAVHVFYNQCPHKALPLVRYDEPADYDDGLLTCIQHRAVFDVDTGACLQGVCAGETMCRIDVVMRGDDVLVA